MISHHEWVRVKGQVYSSKSGFHYTWKCDKCDAIHVTDDIRSVPSTVLFPNCDLELMKKVHES